MLYQYSDGGLDAVDQPAVTPVDAYRDGSAGKPRNVLMCSFSEVIDDRMRLSESSD